jgi:hypothetical protein
MVFFVSFFLVNSRGFCQIEKYDRGESRPECLFAFPNLLTPQPF